MGDSVTWAVVNVLAEATPAQQQGSAETTLLEKSLRKNRGSPYKLRFVSIELSALERQLGGSQVLCQTQGVFRLSWEANLRADGPI